ncbi:MAG: hypothetical protein F6K36_02390 [Symploca sp. SIO3C6]|nr:hypothetical protein [Symploca sp. SIO3C6]NET05674.1 hypothetical protein [Symploca sp. SIO2B6]NET50227.1 hypothetical protein [Merismopedia sp. SIO2A8]
MLRQRKCLQLIRRGLMHFPKRYFFLVQITAAMSLLSASCSESRIVQCAKINKIAGDAVNEVTSHAKGAQAKDPKAALQAAEAMEEASQKMEAVEVQDKKLKYYQTGFVKMYRDTSQATKDFIAAYKKQDREAAELAKNDLLKATTPEEQLLADFDSYCSE